MSSNPEINQQSQAVQETEKPLVQRMQVTDDLDALLATLPPDVAEKLTNHPQRGELIEVVIDLGRKPEARFASHWEYLSDATVTREDIQFCSDRVGMFSGDNRAGIERTLHRISAMRNRAGEIVGLTCRIGRAVYGTIGMIRDLVETGRSILMLGRPGVGKTTALREIARVLADDLNKRVVVIDTSNEIAGDGDIPHPSIGRARRMQVASPELQHQVMIEAVENHMPEVIVIDEIGTELEALAARTIAERGVQLVGTAHGNRLDNLIKNPTLSDLIGGIQAVTLGDEEARRRSSQKTVLERKALPTFDIAVEMLERQRWVVHQEVSETVDIILRGHEPGMQVRSVNEEGEVEVYEEKGNAPSTGNGKTRLQNPVLPRPTGWRASGQMTPVDSSPPRNPDFEQMLDQSWQQTEGKTEKVRTPGPNGEDWPVYVYPYGISRNLLDQVMELLNLPIVLTKDIDHADAVLALRSQVKNHSKLRQLAKTKEIPIHVVKSNTLPQITRTLQRLLDLDPTTAEGIDFRMFTENSNEDELEALEEARLAVEQIVIPKGQPVELLPRPAKVRKMQHELAEHYRLKSDSFGEEPNRRLRIYPA
ncbi:AAA family ATPase [Euhalothece natronophila Z-M001]|uniref:AAA family ATPase n=2 Tax=Euhalothece TaxID=65097 RepID=A0A5B8NP83_9CHRO|nr:AAA family ATPase [Euhalothece natronophila Z-M001]